MNDPRCECRCHFFDDDGIERALLVGWRCPMCGAEPERGQLVGRVTRHVADNGRVFVTDTYDGADRLYPAELYEPEPDSEGDPDRDPPDTFAPSAGGRGSEGHDDGG